MHGRFLYYIYFSERMKKMFKKTICAVLSVVLLLCTFAVTASAAEDITVSLRIEGIDGCLFYDDITVDGEATVYDVLIKADEADDSLTVNSSASQYGAYITSINGITAGTYTTLKWDGWLFMVNGTSPSVGVDACETENGDVIVFYYGDPYNTGMQYPIVSFDAEKGTVTLTSMDTVYDENWNATTAECPVADYTLIWGTEDGEAARIKADENGVAVIPEEYLTYGKHSVQFEKTASNGLPMVLRAAPDFAVEIPDNRSFFEKLIDYITDFFNMIIEFFNSLFA